MITGARARAKHTEPLQDSQDRVEPLEKNYTRKKGAKARQKLKNSNVEPKFNTDLSTPIEEIIEETITDEIKSEALQHLPKKKAKSQSLLKKQKSPHSDKTSTNQRKEENEEDIVGYSFFKQKLPESTNSEKISKKKPNKTNIDVSVGNDQDNVGYSYFSVKEKGRRNKNKAVPEKKDSEETLSTVLVEQSLKKAKEDLSKPSIVDHYSKKGTKGATSGIVSPVNTKVQLEIQKSEAKKSKLVCSTVSYASILANNVERNVDNNTELDSINEVNGTDVHKLINTSEDITAKAELNIPVFDSQTDNTIYQNQKDNIKLVAEDKFEITENYLEESARNISKSNSSSIEIISEFDTHFEQNNPQERETSDLENISRELTSFEIIEENINKIVDIESDLEQLIEIVGKQNESDNPSIPIVNSQTEREDTSAVVDKLLPNNELTNTLVQVSDKLNLLKEVQPNEVASIDSVDGTTLDILSSKEILTAPSQFEQEHLLYTSPVNSDLYQKRHSETEVDDYVSFVTDNSDSSKASSPFEPADESDISVSEEVNEINCTDTVDEVAQLVTSILQPLTTDSQEEFSEHLEEEVSIEESSNLTETSRLIKLKESSSFEPADESEILVSEGVNTINRTDTVDEVDQLVTSILQPLTTDSQEEFSEHLEEEVSIEESSNLTETSRLIILKESSSFEPAEESEILVSEGVNTINRTDTVDEVDEIITSISQPLTADSQEESSEHLEEEVSTEESSNLTETSHLIKLKESSSFEPAYESEITVSERVNTNNRTDTVDEVGTSISQSLTTDSREESSHSEEEVHIEESSSLTETSNPVEFNPLKEITTEDQQSSIELNMTSAQQIRVLTLNNQEHQECTLYRIQKDWIIQFRLGPSLFGRKVYLYCNYPIEHNGKLYEFNRNQYQLLNWELDEGCKNADDTAAYTQIVAKLAGGFHYYFTYESRENAERQGSGFFLVDPILKYGNDEDLSLDCIQCQTVLAKNLASFSSWEKKLQVAKESGYNMIHFSPIQELGSSNSCYSISEQLKLNPAFKKENGVMPQFQEIEQFMAKIRREWKVTSICDIVLNHTANESKWIKEHPEVTYNCINCPYMRPAYLLDAAFYQFSKDVERGLYEDRGIPIEINSEDHLNAIRYHFRTNVLEPLRLQELYICDVNKLVREFLSNARTTTPVTFDIRKEMPEIELIPDPEYKRLAGKIDMKLAIKIYNVFWNDTFDEESRLKRCSEEFKSKLESLNNAIIEKINDHLSAAVENVIAGIRYYRVQPDGPKLKDITECQPLVYRYFTDYGIPQSLNEHEEIMYSSNGRYLMAHNGWVMNSDPLKNFAAADSNIYIRRELIAWGDSVKLRYGDRPEESPFLWEHMRKYVEQIAKIFDGVRLDNCHSTPIPVAEYLIDCARKIKPDLYVVAELFTNSDLTDNIFVNRLGITSLIREAMSAWDSHEEGRLVYRYGGYPVGSFYQPSIRPLVPSIAHALFLDLTHDNPSPVEKRSVFDLLPSTALVNMACCASGSNRGYDELVPHHINVVHETRQYTEWTDDENIAMGNQRYVTKRSGIIAAKKAINDLHLTLGKEGFNQVYVDQMDSDIVAVTRHCPETHESYILVAFTAFGHPSGDAEHHQRDIKPLRFEGVLEEIVLEATLSHISNGTGGSKFAKPEKYANDSSWINGLSEYRVDLKQHIDVTESEMLEKVYSGTLNVTQLNFKNFKPGSIVVIRVSLPEVMRDSVKVLRTLIGSITKNKELVQVIDKLTLADLNRALYRCGQEEKDEGFGFDTYNIPNFEHTVYAGLQGFISLLANIRPNNDLGHPMCANLRDGNWMIEYIWKRLNLDEGTKDLGLWIANNTKYFDTIPRYLVPCYFDAIFTGIYILLIEHCYKLMSTFVNCGSTFVRGLSLGSVQFAAYIKSSDLPILSPNLAPPKPPTRKNDKGETVQACVTLSAGLPHFSVGYMRNWGRDTFIALRGLFILSGRFEEARQHILGYGACLRHGLIPNLLDGGRNPRYNCRDAVWWWLYCIKEYASEVPNGLDILNDKVSRIFPTDDSPAQPPGAVDQLLHEVIQEALTVHFQGLAFRERNAGQQIDAHMTDRGFNNNIGTHPETGFVFGGNEWNCGTWMDKMGSSDKAGNRGKPATPRDGSAVEIIGLSKAVITWLHKLSEEKKYPYSYVERTHKNGSVTKWSFKEWSEKIQANFEKYFWVNTCPLSDEIKPHLINKRGIYKDCYGATQDWTDFQLRCNFPIAMVVAPELFTPRQAWIALNQVEKHLLGPLGMKTLDPDDWAYRGDYDNSNDSDDSSVAHGFNYHQGPEWVWPIGYFLRAKLHFAAPNGTLKETVASTKLILSKHFVELQTSPWRGLPELTNSNGAYCRDSSRTQAWSMSCVLEVLSDLQKIESSQPILN